MRFTLSFTSVCPLNEISMIDRRHLQIFRLKIGRYLIEIILHTWFALLVFSLFDFVPAMGLEEYTTTTHIALQENENFTLFTLHVIRRASALDYI